MVPPSRPEQAARPRSPEARGPVSPGTGTPYPSYDTPRPAAGTPPRPDSGYPRASSPLSPAPDQTGGFERPGAAYPPRPTDSARPDSARPDPRPVDPWNGHGSGALPLPGSGASARTNPASDSFGTNGYHSGGYGPNGAGARRESGPGGASSPDGYGDGDTRGAGGHRARGSDGYGGSGPNGYGTGGSGANGHGPATGAHRLGSAASTRSAPGQPVGPSAAGYAPGASGAAVGSPPAWPGGANPLGGAGVAGTSTVPESGRPALEPGPWSAHATGGQVAADRSRRPADADEAASPWRTPRRDDPAPLPAERRRGAEFAPLIGDPLSGPLPIPASGPGRVTGGRPEHARSGPAAAPARGEPALDPADPLSGPWRTAPAGPPRPAIEDTITTARPSFRPAGSPAALPPGRSAGAGVDQPAAPGVPAAGPRTPAGPEAAGAAPGKARRPESPAEMTSLVTRRGRAGTGPGAAGPGGAGPGGGTGGAERDDDSGWQPSRSVRKTGARSVPADRRRTPNPVTDTDSLQAVVAPARRSTPRPGGASREARDGREDKRGRASSEIEDLRPANRRSRVRGAGAAAGSGGGPDGSGGNGGKGPESRDGRGRRGGDEGRLPGSATRAVGVLESAGAEDEAEEAASATPDRFAWLKQGWIGPLAIALVVSLLVVGAYTVLTGGDEGDEATPQPAVTASGAPTPTTTNPEALAGKALVDGTWRCRLWLDGGKVGDLLPDVLVVESTGLAYRWNDGAGAYTITPTQGDASTTVISDVEFTSGPLQGVRGKSLTKPAAGMGGKAEGTLTLQPAANVPSRICYTN